MFDVILCNGLGIHIGMWICKKMELRTYHWESVKYVLMLGYTLYVCVSVLWDMYSMCIVLMTCAI